MGGDIFVLFLQRQQFKQPLHKVDVAVVEGGSRDGSPPVVRCNLAGLLVQESIDADPR